MSTASSLVGNEMMISSIPVCVTCAIWVLTDDWKNQDQPEENEKTAQCQKMGYAI
jgi:hypothetical protein